MVSWSSDENYILVLTLITYFRRKQRWKDRWFRTERETSEEDNFSSKTND